MRLIVRRVKPSRRDAKKLTAFEKRTGWRYQIVATNIPAHPGLSGVPGSGQVWFVDALYRDHAEVEDRVKAIKRVGLGLLPSKSWQLNAAWVLAATIAADLDARTRTRRRRAGNDPYEAVPPACRPHRSRPPPHPPPGPDLALGGSVHHRLAASPSASSPHLTAGHHPDKNQGGADQQDSGPVEAGAPAASREGPPRRPAGQTGQAVEPARPIRSQTNRG